MTNDGALAHALMHHSHEITKEYEVEVQGPLAADALRRLRDGIQLEDGPTAPAQVVVLGRLPDQRLRLSMRIHEGRNRQIRRMVSAVGGEVLRLIRQAIGPIRLEPLRPGQVRMLTPAEVQSLRPKGNKLATSD